MKVSLPGAADDGGRALGMTLKVAVREQTGLTCSIGITPNKLLSKLASELDKPDGLTLLTDADVAVRIWPLAARKVNGIGPKAAAKLAGFGLNTIGDIAAAEPSFLLERFGKSFGAWLHEASHGRDERPVVTSSEPKSISRETTFDRDLHAVRDRAELGAVFTELCTGLAGDLARMYLRFCERQGFRTEVLSESPAELGGYKELVLRVEGDHAYGRLRFESGGHRVQRVPATETQGRIHTSACTVAVMPEADEVEDVNINPADLRIDTYRASGAGGQHINKTDSAVRITHLPTGIVVECQDDRSQHKNKAQAMKVLAARIKDVQLREQQSKEAATRKSLIGSGDRSERIRTYNYPQGRMTDHRINLTLYKLDFIMDGELTELTNALAAEHQAELLAALGD